MPTFDVKWTRTITGVKTVHAATKVQAVENFYRESFMDRVNSDTMELEAMVVKVEK